MREIRSWIIEDQGSAGGTYADPLCGHREQVHLQHGADIQVGMCRLRLVSFAPGSAEHEQARRYLSERDGLTELLAAEHLMAALDEDGLYADWVEVSMHIALFELRRANQKGCTQPDPKDMLSLRFAAREIIRAIEMKIHSLIPITAGRIGPLMFAVSLVGLISEDVQQLVEKVVSDVHAGLPNTLELNTTILRHEPGRPAREVLCFTADAQSG